MIATAALFLNGTTAQTEPRVPAIPLQQARDAAALEMKIARAEVERTGLLNKWTPASKIVMASNKKLGALRIQLSALRPQNPHVSARTRQQAIREKIVQLEIVRAYLFTQGADKTLDAERNYVVNYLLMLRKNLASLPLQLKPSQRV